VASFVGPPLTIVNGTNDPTTAQFRNLGSIVINLLTYSESTFSASRSVRVNNIKSEWLRVKP
jgi:hypothetical protein